MQKRLVARPTHCEACPFKSRTVGARGPVDAKVVIVGESPGTQEVIQGVPFIGPSGELLSRLLYEVGIDENAVYITNTIKCLPPRSKKPSGDRKKDAMMNDACRACRGALIAELSAYPRDLIIAMGSSASRSLGELWSYSIMKNRGQVLDEVKGVDGQPIAKYGVLPTFHPAYILRNQSALPQLRSDLRKAAKLLSGEGFPKPIVKYKRLQTTQEIDEFVARDIIRHNPHSERERSWRIIADIESTGLDRHRDGFRCIGFIMEHKLRENGENLVYIVTGKNNGKLVKYLFSKVPEYVEWVWHNGKFDTSFMRAKGIPREQCRVDHDTLLLSYTLDETGSRHSLEQCIMDHLGLPSYKDRLKAHMKKTKTTFATVDADHLHQYNAEDTVFTGLLFKKLYPQVFRTNKAHLRQVYSELLVPASNALATIELNGMPIDQEVLLQSKEKLRAEIQEPLKVLREFVGDEKFNPNSPQQVADVLKNVCRLKVETTGKDELKKFKGNKFVDTLLKYRDLTKKLGTYITSFEKYGSRVHTSYLIHGTVTGRLSSSSPNMQNIPKEEIVRRHFRTLMGRVFVSFDYSQAELRSLAVLSGDKNLIEIFKSGKDMHSAVAAEVYGELFTREPEYLPNDNPDIKIENPIFNKYRRNAKTVNFGIVYGATEPTLMERLGITWDEAHKLIDGWFAMFPDAREYMDQCRSAPVDGRPLITVFGRQRRFYVVTDGNRHGQENEAGNFPHQSMCSDFTLKAAIEIDKLHKKKLLPGNACQVNIIHDDNLFEVDDNQEEIIKLVKLVRPLMERVPVTMGITELTFKSDAKMGNDWSKMQKIKGV